MDYLLYFLPILFNLGRTTSNEVTNETSYKKCLTWRDDQDWLHLKCRVADFVLPVTFYHNASNTEVKCRIRRDERGCTPKEKNFTIDKFHHTVTLVLSENKTGRHLEGRWYCKQGDSIKKTDVSFSEGIIKDPTIFLRGTVGNESQYLNIECSSCRRSIGPYVELLLNGKTKASFTQTDNKCVYNNIPCSNSNICDCIETQNAFVLRLSLLNVNATTNISCYMQFLDEFRGIIFEVTVIHSFTGQDFMITGNNAKIVPRIPKPSTPGTSSFGTTQLPPEAPSKSIQPETAKGTTFSSHIPEKVQTVVVPLICIIAVLSILLFGIVACRMKGIWVRIYERKKKTHKNNYKCKSCRLSKAAVAYCFDCYGAFCSGCIGEHHDLHITIPVSKFPPLFDVVSFFKCHADNCYQYFCEDDKKLFCRECENDHTNCKSEEIVKISAGTINSLKENHMQNLVKFKGELDNNLSWLRKGKQKSLKQKTELAGRFGGMKLRRLSKMMLPYYTDISNFKKEINILKSKIKTQITLLELLQSYAEPCHVFIALIKLQDELSSIERKIGIRKKSYYQQKISKDSKNGNFTFEIIKYFEGIDETQNQLTDDPVCDTSSDTPDTSDTPIEHKVQIHNAAHQDNFDKTSTGNVSECTDTTANFDTNVNPGMNKTLSDNKTTGILQNRNTDSQNMEINRHQSQKNLTEKDIPAPVKTDTTNNEARLIKSTTTHLIPIKDEPPLCQSENELQSNKSFDTDKPKDEPNVPQKHNRKSESKKQGDPERQPLMCNDIQSKSEICRSDEVFKEVIDEEGNDISDLIDLM